MFDVSINELLIILSAVGGLVIGIINTININNEKKVRITVIPQTVVSQERFVDGLGSVINNKSFNPDYNTGLFGMDIINKSQFPVTIAEAGFIRRSIMDPQGWTRK